MKYFTKAFIFLTAVLAFFSCSGGNIGGECNRQKTEKAASLRIVNWNVQTFFDAQCDGNEYSEFIKSRRWGEEPYKERLRRLCSVIRELDADVFVMEELESASVMHDISNFLAGEWNVKKQYLYGCYAKNEGSAIGCGVLSRIPLENMRVHNLDVRSESEEMPRLRPLIEVSVVCGNSDLVLLVNHWKSKSGGAEVTEKWRVREECVLAERICALLEQDACVLALGDFNRDILEFEQGSAVAGVSLRTNSGRVVQIQSPWFDEDGLLLEPGSYFFRDEWSRIDNMFAAGGARIVSFGAECSGPWCEEITFVPKKYTVWNGEGYSDHLPVSCEVEFF